MTCRPIAAGHDSPPDSGGQINPFGMPPLADAGRLDTDQIGGDAGLVNTEA